MSFKVITSCQQRLWNLFHVSKRFRSTLYNLPGRDGKRADSYYHGIEKYPLVSTTIGHLLDLGPDRFADRLGYIDKAQGIRKTFAEVKEDVDKLASGLLALNFQKGDRIGVWSPNKYEWVVGQMASAKAGLILVTINPAYQASEFEYCIKKTGMRGVIFPEKFYVQEYYKIICSLVPEIQNSKPGFIKTEKFPHLEALIVMSDNALPGTFTFSEVMNASGSKEKESLVNMQSKISPDDPVMILLTSGTTSKPKAVALSHFALINGCTKICNLMRYFDEKHSVCCHVPMFHVFGSAGGGMAPIISGLTCVFPSPEYNVTKSLMAIEEEKCTAIYGTPAMYIDMMRHQDFKLRNLSSVKALFGGGDRFSPSLIRQIYVAFPNSKIYLGYGSTESAGMGSLEEFDRSWTDEQLNHAGRIVESVEVKIVNSENQMVPFGSDGEICSRSVIAMKGYWEDDDKTREIMKEGWYHTGDLGSLSADGRLTVSGRIKDLIIRGGENIGPTEVESVLVTHPSIAYAQVFGVNDDRLNEEVCTWLILNENCSITAEEVKEFCKGKMAHYKIPKYVKVVDNYPMTRTGKVQKFLMKEEMNKLLHN